jgi:hypothetical protein
MIFFYFNIIKMDLLKYIYLYKIRINDGYYDNKEKLFLIKSK